MHDKKERLAKGERKRVLGLMLRDVKPIWPYIVSATVVSVTALVSCSSPVSFPQATMGNSIRQTRIIHMMREMDCCFIVLTSCKVKFGYQQFHYSR